MLAAAVASPVVASGQSVPTIRGNEPLVWDQPASPDLRPPIGFVLYVDGVAGTLTDVSCQPASGGYTCVASLPSLDPGPHLFELAAISAGGRSEPSATLSVVVLPPAPVSGPAAVATPMGAAACPSSSGCTASSVVATLNGRVTALAPLSDGRLLFAENGYYVRILAAGQLAAAPALRVDAPSDRIIAIAADPAFARTRAVFVAIAHEPSPAQRTLSVVRYREVAGVLGQPATVVADLALPLTGDPRVGFDEANNIYVAFPAGAAARGSGQDPYSAAVLRFAEDGTVTQRSGAFSPVVASGFPVPTALATDAAAHRVWIAGSGDGSSPSTIAWLSSRADAASALTSAATIGGTDGRTAPAVVSMAGAPRALYYVTGDGVLYAAAIDAAGRLAAPQPMSLGDRVAESVTADAAGDLLVVTRDAAGPAGPATLLKLSR